MVTPWEHAGVAADPGRATGRVCLSSRQRLLIGTERLSDHLASKGRLRHGWVSAAGGSQRRVHWCLSSRCASLLREISLIRTQSERWDVSWKIHSRTLILILILLSDQWFPDMIYRCLLTDVPLFFFFLPFNSPAKSILMSSIITECYHI